MEFSSLGAGTVGVLVVAQPVTAGSLFAADKHQHNITLSTLTPAHCNLLASHETTPRNCLASLLFISVRSRRTTCITLIQQLGHSADFTFLLIFSLKMHSNRHYGSSDRLVRVSCIILQLYAMHFLKTC